VVVGSAISSDSLVRREPLAFEYLSRILNAKVYDVCKITDLHHAPVVSKKTGNKVFLKREDQQRVYSFKLRGAYNRIVHLSPEEKAKGICACSAGNHAQGVAYSAAKLGLSAKIFMPKTTPSIKVEAVESYVNEQSEVILVGSNYDEAYAATEACVKEEGRVLVHPFNDPLVIAGQGTIGQEVLAQTTQEEVDAVFCCVGGGGLLAGVGIFLKAVKPNIKVIGVEALDSAAMTTSLAAGKIVELPTVGLFADGAAVRKVGDESFRICQMACDEMVTVSTDDICSAIKDAFIDTRVLLEPAGALALAGLKKYAERTRAKGKTFVAVTSGANMDFDRLRFVSERADTSETTIAAQIPERAGAFIELYKCIYPRNVTEFSYRYSDDPASIFMSFQATSPEDREYVMKELETKSFSPLDLSGNEMAQTHVRHLAGGRPPAKATEEEALFSFQFPERPGSLLNFLKHLPQDFNVSLFHYRSHGADVARVLVALQVPAMKRTVLREYLDYLTSEGFSWSEETANPAYHRFLLEPVVANMSGRSKPRTPLPLFLS
jgi:threonine dehydratase